MSTFILGDYADDLAREERERIANGGPMRLHRLGDPLVFAGPEGRITMSHQWFKHYAEFDQLYGPHVCNGNGCRIESGAPVWLYRTAMCTFVICVDCVQRFSSEWHIEALRREKGRIEQQEHPSQARIAELNQEIGAAIARASR